LQREFILATRILLLGLGTIFFSLEQEFFSTKKKTFVTRIFFKVSRKIFLLQEKNSCPKNNIFVARIKL